MKGLGDLTNDEMHRWLRTIYFKHNLFKQSKKGQDVEVQNMLVLLESLQDLMQVSTLSAQLGLGSEIVAGY